MSDFLEYVFWELKNSFKLVFLAGSLALGVLGITYFVHKRRYRGEKK